MNDLAVVEEISEAKIVEYLDSMGKTNSLLANEKKLFINIAKEFRLNPFKRERGSRKTGRRGAQKTP
jgi:hypothetical protein